MPRSLVLGNGQLLFTLDDGYAIRDIYYPYVGLWNHVGGHRCRMGVWVSGRFSWVGEPGWTCELGYESEGLVGQTELRNEILGLALHCTDVVHHQENIYIRRVAVESLAETEREVRVFFHQDLSLDDTDIGDTAVYDPSAALLYHYKRDRYVMVNGRSSLGGIYEYATGVKRFRGAEGTWRDAEDGRLEGNPIAQGSVDSTVSFRLQLPARGQETVWYWLCLGKTYGQTLRLDQMVRAATPDTMVSQVRAYWQTWVHKQPLTFANLSPSVAHLYGLSLAIVRAHIDRTGGITAANDSDILQYNRDHYSYVWPRDGALISRSIIASGYPELVAPFFHFCAHALTQGGFLLQKYNPDGSAGSCWHPWIQNGRQQLPIQEDETALVLWALWEHYQRSRDSELVLQLIPTLIQPAAEFLLGYIHPHLGLPRETYDLWEERRGVHTWTCAAVYGALEAASQLVALVGDRQNAQRYRLAAERVRDGIIAHLFDTALGRFVRTLQVAEDGSVRRDPTPDSSIAGLFLFGVLPANDPHMAATMRILEERLWVQTEVGGMARYTGDQYFRTNWYDFDSVPGNPWFITTLWLADWYTLTATNRADLERSRELLQWVVDQAMPTGILPEQVNPYNGSPLSVAPLCWSHATFCFSVLSYLDRWNALEGTEESTEEEAISSGEADGLTAVRESAI